METPLHTVMQSMWDFAPPPVPADDDDDANAPLQRQTNVEPPSTFRLPTWCFPQRTVVVVAALLLLCYIWMSGSDPPQSLSGRGFAGQCEHQPPPPIVPGTASTPISTGAEPIVADVARTTENTQVSSPEARRTSS